MKTSFKSFFTVVGFLISSSTLFSCGSDDAPTPSANFTAMVGTEKFSSSNGKIIPSAGSAVGCLADDGKGNSFTIAIFEKDFPVNTAKNVAFSPSISYTNAKKEVYIAKSGTMTITTYEKTSAGILTGIKGNFDFVATSTAGDITISKGQFDLKK